ncbi:MAG: T9SS type A sorting domain-containing protein, partial [Bacteroidota bacterium]
GGGNAGKGGIGGYEVNGSNIGGLGGKSTNCQGLFFGGGGGSGHNDNVPNQFWPYPYYSYGGDGGGIIIIIARELLTNGGVIKSDGGDGELSEHDGAGGGGAGGTVYIQSTNPIPTNITVSVLGGKGGDVTSGSNLPHGPGGAGSGGVVVCNGSVNFSTSTAQSGTFQTGSAFGAVGGDPPSTCGYFNIPQSNIEKCAVNDTQHINVCKNEIVTLTAAFAHPNTVSYTHSSPYVNPTTNGNNNFKIIARTGTYYIRHNLPNGCHCLSVFIVNADPIIYTDTVKIKCGESVDLKSYQNKCDGKGIFWVDRVNNLALSNTVVSPKTNTLYSRHYYLNGYKCQNCIRRVYIVVLPKSSEYDTVLLCGGGSYTLKGPSNCGSGLFWNWYYPNQSFNTIPGATRTITPANNSTYKIEKVLADGCKCEKTYFFKTQAVYDFYDTIEIDCGSQIDLESRVTIWKGESHHWTSNSPGFDSTNISPVITLITKAQFTRYTYADSAKTCLAYRYHLTVKIKKNEFTQDVYACEGESIYLKASPQCGPGVDHKLYNLYNGQLIGSSTLDSFPVVASNSQYVLVTTYPNGCTCTKRINVFAQGPYTLRDTITIECGDSVNLEQFNRCGGTTNGWRQLEPFAIILPSPTVTPSGTTLYQRNSYKDSTLGCLNCIMELVVNVVPKLPRFDTIRVCEGQSINIGLNTGCGNGVLKKLYFGDIIVASGEGNSIFQRIAQIGDEYRLVTEYENGCKCETFIKVETVSPEVIKKEIEVDCPANIDLNAYNECPAQYLKWEDESGNPLLSSQVSTNGKGITKFRIKQYDDGLFTCLKCITEIELNFKETVISETIQAPCDAEALPIKGNCDGVTYEWTDNLGNELNGDVYGNFWVYNLTDTSFYSVVAIDSLGCKCRTKITILPPIPPTPALNTFNLSINCGDSVDYSLYDNYCAGGKWNPHTDNGKFKVTDDIVLSKETRDSNNCLTCKLKVIVSISNPPSTIVDDSTYEYCINPNEDTLRFAPPSNCGQGIYPMWWINQNLISTEFILKLKNPQSGTYTRILKDEKGCDVCREKFKVKIYQPLTDTSNIDTVDVFYCGSPDENGCVRVALSPKLNIYNWETCKWGPANVLELHGNNQSGEDSLLICNFSNGDVFTRRCTVNGCLVELRRVKILPASCKMGDNEETTTVGDILFLDKVKVYPNPNTGVFKIEFGTLLTKGQVTMADILGRVILTKKVSNLSSMDVSIPSIDKGVYFITVKSEKGQSIVKVVVE